MPSNQLTKLIELVPPLGAPTDHVEAVLTRNEAIMRLRFPTDFIEFGRTYGSGTFRSAYTWEVWSPFRLTYPFIVLRFSRTWQLFKESMEIDDVPFGLFPEVGGLLPFSKTPDGDWVCWQTAGEPDDWTVVDMGQYENGQYQLLPMSFSEYFLKVLSREVVLDRHKNGDAWDPTRDLTFSQVVHADSGFRIAIPESP